MSFAFGAASVEVEAVSTMAYMGVCQSSCISSLPQKIFKLQKNLRLFFPIPQSKLQPSSCKASIFTNSIAQDDDATPKGHSTSSIFKARDFSLAGLEDVLTGYLFGKRKATEVVHSIWKTIVKKGDMVIDATCGNGYDTLAMLKLVADEMRRGRVLGMDLQKDALESTSSLLDQSVGPDERELVELYAICHTKMEEIVPQGAAVRLVAFNLGYLPGGDKKIKTEPETTLHALEAAERILAPGGLISLVVYIGHSGGREELEIVKSFACGLSANNWICCQLQTLNRPLAPVVVLLSKK